MTDLQQRFRELDRLDVPDMRTDIKRRATTEPMAPPIPVMATAPRWRGPLIAFGTAAVILVVAVATVLLLRGDDSIMEPAETVPTPTVITTVPTTQPTTDLSDEAAFTLVPVPGVDPIRVSTVLGDFEFVTMQLPPSQESDSWAHLAATPDGPVLVTDRATTIRIHVDDRGDAVVIGGPPDLADDSDPSSASERSQYSGLGANTRVASGPRGVVIASLSTISYSADGSPFTEAERGPDPTIFVASDQNPEDAEYAEAARTDCRGTFGAEKSVIRAVVATDAGFVAFTSASHPADAVCAPLLWFSADGNTWELVSPESPFGELTEINTHSIAERGGRFVVIGGVEAEMQGHVWVSDDAVTWRQADLPLAVLLTLDAGDLGWVLTGAESMPGEADDFALWFSADGYTWDGPHPLPEALLGGYFVPEFVVGPDTILGLGIQEQVLVIGRPSEGAATP
jgi:hypothetical protein